MQTLNETTQLRMRARRLSRARARRGRGRRRRRGRCRDRRRRDRHRRRNRRGRNGHRSSRHGRSGRHGRSRDRSRCSRSDRPCCGGRHEQRLRAIHAQRRPNAGGGRWRRLHADDDERASAAVRGGRPDASRGLRRLPDGACAAGKHASAQSTSKTQTLRRRAAPQARSGPAAGQARNTKHRADKARQLRCAGAQRRWPRVAPPPRQTYRCSAAPSPTRSSRLAW